MKQAAGESAIQEGEQGAQQRDAQQGGQQVPQQGRNPVATPHVSKTDGQNAASNGQGEDSNGGNASPPSPQSVLETVEGQRLQQDEAAWRRWGPYLAERAWGTVREDYSANGDAWSHFPHDHARSRAYRWSEDGLAGFSDDQSRWCLSLGLWNGQDPIIKERLFGLSNTQGNHGEDVKELYFFQDGTPSHSYMRMLYRYPQRAFPYQQLIDENARRSGAVPEFELLETGIFDDKRFFDVTVEYAKASPNDILQRITIHNAASEEASIDVLSQLVARNIWSWGDDHEKPQLRLDDNGVVAIHEEMMTMRLDAEAGPLGAPRWLFCENESNPAVAGVANANGIYKDGINDYIVHDRMRAVRSDHGSKCAAHYHVTVAAGASVTLRLRWREHAVGRQSFDDFDGLVQARRR
ncbi:MAG: hypothetical protein ACRYF5_17715, partial [Janthinobacterium lividum]